MAEEEKDLTQEGRKPGDPDQVEQNPNDGGHGGDVGTGDATGAGPSGGAPADTSTGSGGDGSATGAGPSGGA